MVAELTALRDQIDEVDKALLSLLAKRLELVAEVGEHRSFILPRHVALERFLRGEERHGRHRIHIGLVGAGHALRTARKPAVCTLYADARRRGGHSLSLIHI